MDFIKAITPKDTEEVKPGVFLQKKGNKYRQIYPAAWNGKINWKNFIFGGPNFWKTLIWIIIIGFMVFSYINDTQELSNFYNTVVQNKQAWCAGIPLDEISNYTINITDHTRGGVINGADFAVHNNNG